MAGVWLGWLLAAALAPGDEPAVLVERLGSTRSGERRAAAEALERMGPEALPALRAARDSNDLVVRAEAAALLDAIEAGPLTRPTLVTLDFRERPIVEVVEAIEARTGQGLVVGPEGDPRWRTRRIDLEAMEPLPFWSAIDRLCRAGGLRVEPGPEGLVMRPRFGFGGGPRRRLLTGSEVALTPDDGRASPPTSDFGPFRILLLGLRLHRDHVFARVPGVAAGPAISERFAAQLLALAEPRLALARAGEPTVLEALDDLGQSLVPGPETSGPAPVGRIVEGGARPAAFELRLRYPDRAGRTIKRLRGTFPAAISGRLPDPLVIPLAGSLGKTFRAEDASIVIHEVKPGPNGQGTTVDLTIGAPAASQPGAGFGIPNGPGPGLRPPPSSQPQLEFVDARGRVCQGFALTSYGLASGARRTLNIAPVDSAGAPVEVRYYRLAWTTLDVPFEFHDVPMP
jgi:hypothetical protein